MKCKSLLRRIAVADRDKLSPQEIRRRSDAASSHLFALPEFRAAGTIMFFISFGSEIDTIPMVEAALAGGRRVAAPRSLPDTRELVPCQVRSVSDDLAPGAHNIREPKAHCPPIPLDQIDLVIVPAAAWGEDGYRVGYGGGYYDRFLPRLPRAARVGLGLEMQVIPDLPIEPQDLPVDMLITETGVRRFVRPDPDRPKEEHDGTRPDPT